MKEDAQFLAQLGGILTSDSANTFMFAFTESSETDL